MSNPRQITKYQTGKYLLEALDFLQVADTENASHIHHKYSRIRLVGLDYSKGTGTNTVTVDVNLDPGAIKYLAEAFINSLPVSGRTFFSEQKILAHNKDSQGRAKATAITIYYDNSRTYCWQITIENGVGIAQRQSTGGVAMQKGSYQKQKAVSVYMSDMEIKKFFIKVRDYINTWETIHLRMLLNERAKYEAGSDRQVYQ